MQGPLLVLILLITSCSSKEQRSLIGEWKPVKVSYNNLADNTTMVIYDKYNIDTIKNELFQKYISQDSSDSDLVQIDTLEFKNTLDKEFAKFDSARLILKNNSNALIKSYGLIIPAAEPGWHFGDKARGKWATSLNKFLKLTIGDDKVSHPFFYRIIKHTGNRLILGQTSSDYTRIFMTFEFARQ